jgi:putative FmdB family regulatory protein
MSYHLAVEGLECQLRREEGLVPTYQYACTACDEQLEVVQKFTDDPLTVCGVCGGKLRKVYSAVGIVFKGSGFYRTDSRNGAVAAGAKDKAADGSGGSAGGEASGAGGAGSPAEKSGSGDPRPGPGDAKAAKKAETAGTGGSSATGSKVA